MRLIARLLEFLALGLIGLVIEVLVILLLVMPQMQWNASARPSAAESWTARYVLGNWVRINASSEHNPIAPTPENLQDGEREYDEHCAVCHGFGGDGENQLGADFYPPVARLSEGLIGLSDGALYFIVSKGIRMTAMPGFGTRHSRDELWKMILWVRHLPNLTPRERAAIQTRIEKSEPGEIGH
jgi:mono/diheme cytochrome c family protein